jgi:hypothetical protein
MEHKETFSSSVMIGDNKSNISRSMRRLEEENKVEKWAEKVPPIATLEDTQSPEFNLRKFTASDFLLIRVEV